MSDSLTQQVTSLLKRLGSQLNRKVAEIVMILVNHKNAGSFGAIAGLAIAIIFTWKFLKPPKRPRRNQRKRLGSESTNNSAASPSASHATRAISDSSVEPSNELHPPSKLTLGALVKKKLNGSRKITCQLLGVILEERTPEELQEHATVRPSVVEVLLEISRSCDVYLMDSILDDESGERVFLALDNAGLFKSGGLMKDKVLFSSTVNGRTSFIRQLEPDLHVDTNSDIISQLSRFIRRQLYVSPTESSVSGSNIISSKSLEYYFSEE